ncbi:MAG: calcium-transporting P-type ATPase, PMR1-type [Selenomonadales bacterium]|nr:calcium-transporting P-type ATPase, PMR1-type [Selenomonadales bacterium]
MYKPFYTLSTQELEDKFKVSIHIGLTNEEVARRREKYGENRLSEERKRSWWMGFAEQFQDFMVLVLLGATLISAFLGEYTDAVTILVIVLVNAILGFVQEYRAEQSMRSLRELSSPTARVLRHGNRTEVLSAELVPGDVILLEAGDKVPADARIVEDVDLFADESPLTGESMPVHKHSRIITDEKTPLGDQANMLHAGTVITKGRAVAIVCATGMQTSVGRIAGMIQDHTAEKTPLEVRLQELGKYLVAICFAICALVVAIGVWRGEEIFLMCMAGISLAVAAIPEGLPAIVTVVLALGMQKMMRRKAIIRKLPAVETLGCVTVICSDKTGTLTQNKMTVREIVTLSERYEVAEEQMLRCEHDTVENSVISDILRNALETAVLCNNAVIRKRDITIGGHWRSRQESVVVDGDPTEGALTIVGTRWGIWREQLEQSMVRVGEIAFTSERKRMSVVYEKEKERILYTKGAPDRVLELCGYYLDENGVVRALSPQLKRDIEARYEEMASRSLRVLATSYRIVKRNETITEAMERQLIFTGLFGMMDPPRPEASMAIRTCREAGVRTIMITGDHPSTALAIAKEIGICQGDGGNVLTGRQIDSMTEQDFSRAIRTVSVYARVAPEHKLKIVRALKQQGEIVAMTGDGVNDAPAIREANVGIAMGKSGTDVAREASAMVLSDDNFATITAAIEEGRGIYDNIRKFIRYLLACNTGEVLTMFLTSLLGMPLPLLPVQILWVNLVTDGLPAMALGIDPNEKDSMKRPPRKPNEGVFSRGLSRKIVFRGIQIGVTTVAVFGAVYYMTGDLIKARTMALTTLVMCQMFHVLDCRSEYCNALEAGIFRNRFLIWAMATSIMMHIAVIYVPFLQEIFSTVSLAIEDWGIILLVSGWQMLFYVMKLPFSKRKIARTSFYQ